MRRVSSRAPPIRWPGASEETIQLSTTEPTAEPIMPPIAAVETPRIAPPMLPPMAAPAAPSTSVAIGQGLFGNRKAKATRRRQDGVSGSSITPSRS